MAAFAFTGSLACAASPEGRLIAVRGSQLYIESFGHGRPILFLHGGLHFFDNSFGPQRDYFSSFRQVIGIDQRGHGHSPDTPAPFSYREMAEDTAAVITQLGIGPVDVVGHSDGADVALLLARFHPELVHLLAISGANLSSGNSPEATARLEHYTAAQIAQHLPPMLADWKADYVKVAPRGAADWESLVSKDWQLWLTSVVLDPAELKEIKIPVLVMAGDDDLVPLDETLRLFHGLPHAQLFILPNTGHGTFTDSPALLNPTLRRFLESPARAP